MTTDEFSNELDTRLSKYNINLNEYEKSIYLTSAQTEIVKSYFPVGIERNAKIGIDLKELIKGYISEDKITSLNKISDDSKFFKVPDNILFILQEQCNIISSDTCLNGKLLDIVPKTHDEYNVQIKNPFRKPSSSIVWRLYYSKQNLTDNVELISPYDISKYRVRYIAYPEPIVLTNLSTGSFGEGLSIDGVTTYQTCKLNESIHRDIVNKAIELILTNYNPKQG